MNESALSIETLTELDEAGVLPAAGPLRERLALLREAREHEAALEHEAGTLMRRLVSERRAKLRSEREERERAKPLHLRLSPTPERDHLAVIFENLPDAFCDLPEITIDGRRTVYTLGTDSTGFGFVPREAWELIEPLLRGDQLQALTAGTYGGFNLAVGPQAQFTLNLWTFLMDHMRNRTHLWERLVAGTRETSLLAGWLKNIEGTSAVGMQGALRGRLRQCGVSISELAQGKPV